MIIRQEGLEAERFEGEAKRKIICLANGAFIIVIAVIVFRGDLYLLCTFIYEFIMVEWVKKAK